MFFERLALSLASIAASASAAALTSPQLAPALRGDWGLDLADQDRSIRPGDDFARFQNGGWVARTRLGPNVSVESYWRDVRLLASWQVSSLLDSLDQSGAAESPAIAKAAIFHRAAIDSQAAEAAGLAPLQPEVEAIRAVSGPGPFAALVGAAEGPGTLRAPSVRVNPGRGVFTLAIGPDARDPGREAVYLGQGGLMLPGPEYYSDPSLADIKLFYRDHVARTLATIGWESPVSRADEIVALESRIAAVSWSHARLRDPAQTYNPMTPAELARLAPGFDWRAFLGGAGLASVGRVVVDAPSAVAEIAAIVAATPLDLLKARQAYATAELATPWLDSPRRAEAAAFQARVQQGLQSPGRAFEAEKWLEACLPDALGALYAAHYSSPADKKAAEQMARLLKAAMDRRLERLAWMSQAGRAAARRKLAAMRVHIGFPDRFDDYAGLEIRPGDLYGNVRRAAAYAWRRDVARLGRPIDRSEWQLAPFYPQYAYIPAANLVEIPAALLLPPFFDRRADPAVNYGADGTILGAMIASAFGLSGIQYDTAGRLRPWLPPADSARLSAFAARLDRLYSAEAPLPGIHIKGELVVDEALGDLGGVEIALDAYHASLGGRAAPVRDGLDGDQRFFLARAQMWRAIFSPDFLRNQLATGSNAPPYMRINGPLPNVDAWYAAFAVRPGDRLYRAPADRVHVW
ncbi:MAG: putative endopeptidase [Alphaproteobacteria bacterium]|nr:putative endopeptidase [Alphaproteobacteria bacterium]